LKIGKIRYQAKPKSLNTPAFADTGKFPAAPQTLGLSGRPGDVGDRDALFLHRSRRRPIRGGEPWRLTGILKSRVSRHATTTFDYGLAHPDRDARRSSTHIFQLRLLLWF